MKNYELGFILKPVLSNEEKAETIEKVKAYVTKFEGVIVNVEDWGKKELTYEIAKYREGYYCFIKFTSNTDAVAKIENECRLSDAIIRFIIVAEEVVEAKPAKKRPARKPRPDFKKNPARTDRTERTDRREKTEKSEVAEVVEEVTKEKQE